MRPHWLRRFRSTWPGGLGAACLLAFVMVAGVQAAEQSTRVSTDDYVAIQQLYAEFNTALDLGQADRYAATWVDDGEFTGGRGPGHAADVRTPIRGKAELWEMGRRAGTGTRHMVTNLVVTPTREGARVSCYLLLMNARNSPSTVTETAIYDDTLVKTKRGWKFKKRINWRDDDDISPFKPKSPPPDQPPGAAPSGAAPQADRTPQPGAQITSPATRP